MAELATGNQSGEDRGAVCQAGPAAGIWQTATALIPYFVLFYLALRSVEISLWLTVPLCVLRPGS